MKLSSAASAVSRSWVRRLRNSTGLWRVSFHNSRCMRRNNSMASAFQDHHRLRDRVSRNLRASGMTGAMRNVCRVCMAPGLTPP